MKTPFNVEGYNQQLPYRWHTVKVGNSTLFAGEDSATDDDGLSSSSIVSILSPSWALTTETSAIAANKALMRFTRDERIANNRRVRCELRTLNTETKNEERGLKEARR